MKSSLHRIFYISQSLSTPDDITRILETSRRENMVRGITGALLFTGGHFAQLLEGDPEFVEETMKRIEADTRHAKVTRLVEGPAETRRFERWSMAFVDAIDADKAIRDHLLNNATSPGSAERAEALLNLLFEPYFS